MLAWWGALRPYAWPVPVDPSSIDPTTAATAASAAASAAVSVVKGSKALGWAGQKLLGPLLDEIGEGWKERYSLRRKENLALVIENAAAKGQARIEAGQSVSPRVTQRIIEDGSWAEGPLMAEYFGGIWASSLSPHGDDDRGLVWAALVSRLSRFHIHLHYLAYEAMRRLHAGSQTINLSNRSGREACGVYLPMVQTLWVLGREPSVAEYNNTLFSAASVLAREDLIKIDASGDPGDFRTKGLTVPEPGLLLKPRPLGIELFMWAHGRSDLQLADFLNPGNIFELDERIEVVSHAADVETLI